MQYTNSQRTGVNPMKKEIKKETQHKETASKKRKLEQVDKNTRSKLGNGYW
ncbi:MAG: hypothetical protein F6J99_03930 [Moorea sp. SIO4G3]|nr:hypothetical protein [Moorena sp. SIO4G3]